VDEIDIIETMDTSVRVQPLTDTTLYEFYLSILCPTDSMTTDTSIARGPFEVFTPLSTDVGISAVLNPLSGCELGFEDIEIEIANFGGQPLTFIPFDFSINGLPGGVQMPEDGLFVGVVGAGESEITEFDVQGNFSAPGTYTLEVWTALDGDQDTSNDTFSIEIINAPLVTDFPYDQAFEENSGFFAPIQDGLGANSWSYGQPSGSVLSTAASGENVWATNLSGQYNPNELSYLVSPCLDFTEATSDYVISFAYNTNIPFFSGDGVFIEVTTDDENWARLGTAGSGINWYNNFGSQYWDGTSGGWQTALQELGDFAGEELVRFRFVLVSNPFTQLEGFAFDDVYIGPRGAIDLAATNVEVIQNAACGSPEDIVSFSYTNLGQNEITNYTLNYQVNGGDVVSEPLDLALLPGGSALYEFSTTFDGTQATTIEILAWVSLDGDEVVQNDTISTIVTTVRQIPLYEDFESGQPQGWQLDPSTIIAQDHGSPTTVLFTNLSASNQIERLVTANYGAVELGDSLAFDYRFVDVVDGQATTLLGDDVTISIIENCGENEILLGVINSFTHTPTTALTRISFSLDAFAGSDIQVVFDAEWADGNYYLDLDNINIKRCPETLGIETEVTDASTNVSTDGAISVTINQGVGPFTYNWSNGEMTQDLSNVPSGDYTLIVTDVQGCTDMVDVRVDFLSGTEDEITNFGRVIASPNPTSGRINLGVDLLQVQTLDMEVLDQLGRSVLNRSFGRVDQVQQDIDLHLLATGLYFIRLTAGNQVHTIRVVKVR
ncbi:MAG: T9SS type A sorting domain-containing protein, partial [Bacteroidota bacterium]